MSEGNNGTEDQFIKEKPQMTTVMGTKEIKSSPMKRGIYNQYRGWTIPTDEDPNEEGFLVEYKDSNSCHPNHGGYISWTPKEAYLSAYKENGSLTFGHAIVALKQGKRVQRSGWNGSGLFVFMQVPAEIGIDIVPKMQSLPQSVKHEFMQRKVDDDSTREMVDDETAHIKTRYPTRDSNFISYKNQLAMVYPDNSIYGWVANPSDVLEEDWEILD